MYSDPMEFLEEHLQILFDGHARERNLLLCPVYKVEHSEMDALEMLRYSDCAAERAWINGLMGDSIYQMPIVPRTGLPAVCKKAFLAYARAKYRIAYADGYAWALRFCNLMGANGAPQ